MPEVHILANYTKLLNKIIRLGHWLTKTREEYKWQKSRVLTEYTQLDKYLNIIKKRS